MGRFVHDYDDKKELVVELKLNQHLFMELKGLTLIKSYKSFSQEDMGYVGTELCTECE